MDERKQKAIACIAQLFSSRKALFLLEEMATCDSFTKRDVIELYFKRFGRVEEGSSFVKPFLVLFGHGFLEEHSVARAFKYVPTRKWKRFYELVSRFIDDVGGLLDEEDENNG